MRGILIHYNAESQQGLIRADDGKRYAFYRQDWQSERQPTINDEIDFEIDGTIAYDIYVLKAGRAPASAAPPVDLTKLRANVAQTAQDLSGNPVAQRLFGNWAAVFAIVVLLGCFLPYLTISSAFGGRAEGSSLMGTAGLIGQMIGGIDQAENIGRAFAQKRRPPNAQNLDAIRWTLRIGYLLYIVPLFAIWLIVAKARGKAARGLAFMQGLISVVVPIVVPVLFSVAVYAQLPPEARQLGPAFSSLINISFAGIGLWVMVIGGIAQLLARFGVLRKAPLDFFAAKPVA